ncbi:unnamed protein product [Allacma fusca]|uniref:Uncharacterized protein n=1 Tax=Allacma fusca TaxID=39272 RepID=A0A8J2L005_9HEXA|nr:unnamed protein product [Allacma fusca]
MPFEKLLTKFREGKYNTNLQVLEDSNEKDKAERDAEMKRMRDQFEEEKKDQENRMNKMREQFEEDNQRRAYELSEVKRAHTEEMGRMQGMISDLRTQISDQESSNVVSSFFNLVGTIGSALINRESNKSFDR